MTQHGPRRLWDELEKAHAAWRHAGRPTRDQVLLTVTATGHRYAFETLASAAIDLYDHHVNVLS